MASSDILDRAKSDIEKHGWHVLSVVDNELPNFSYSVGFTETLQHPEIIISGLSTKLMHALINDIGALIQKGHRFTNGQLSEDVIKGFPAKFVEVSLEKKKEYLCVSSDIYGLENFDALQCLWPNKNGVFVHESSDAQEVLS